MNYNDFAAKLSRLDDSHLPHVFLLSGEEPYFIDRAAELILSRLLPTTADRSDGLTVLDGESDPNVLEQELSAIPFFGERAVVMVKQSKILGDRKKADKDEGDDSKDKKKGKADKALDNLLTTIADMPETNYVIFRQNMAVDKRKRIYKTLEKAGMVMESAPLRPWQAADWLTDELGRRGFRLEPAAFEYLSGALSALHDVPLGYLAGELDKLELFLAGQGIKPGGKSRTMITAAQVKESFSRLPEISGFAIVEAIDDGRGADALKLFAEELQGGTYLPVIAGLLLRRVREYLTAKTLLKRGLRGRELSQALGQTKFYPNLVNRLTRTVNGKDEAVLKKVFLDLADADYRLKTGQGGAELLEAAIIALSRSGK